MLATKVIIATFAVLQVVYCQDHGPPQCRGPPAGDLNFQECCAIPLVFSEEELAACGIVKPEEGKPRPRPDPTDCTKSICVLTKRNLIKDGENIDKDAAKAFLDNYVVENPEFADAVKVTKEECLGPNGPRGPKKFCEPNRFIGCVAHTLFENCPNWGESDSCQKVKTSVEECKALRPNE